VIHYQSPIYYIFVGVGADQRQPNVAAVPLGAGKSSNPAASAPDPPDLEQQKNPVNVIVLSSFPGAGAGGQQAAPAVPVEQLVKGFSFYFSINNYL
jgi:hypothetical protein